MNRLVDGFNAQFEAETTKTAANWFEHLAANAEVQTRLHLYMTAERDMNVLIHRHKDYSSIEARKATFKVQELEVYCQAAVIYLLYHAISMPLVRTEQGALIERAATILQQLTSGGKLQTYGSRTDGGEVVPALERATLLEEAVA